MEHRAPPIWRLHTGLWKFEQNITTNICSLGQRRHLQLGEVSCLPIFYNIMISWRYSLNSFRFIFSLRDSEIEFSDDCERGKISCNSKARRHETGLLEFLWGWARGNGWYKMPSLWKMTFFQQCHALIRYIVSWDDLVAVWLLFQLLWPLVELLTPVSKGVWKDHCSGNVVGQAIFTIPGHRYAVAAEFMIGKLTKKAFSLSWSLNSWSRWYDA